MSSKWEVEFSDEFYQTSEDYMARYNAPSNKATSEPLSLPFDQKSFVRDGEHLVASIAQAVQLFTDPKFDLGPVKHGPFADTRDLGSGSWLFIVLIQYQPMRARVLPVFHRSDTTDEQLRSLIEQERRRFKQGHPKRKNDQT